LADVLRLTRFFGTLLLINVAVGVVTGLVQEFQFGMDWSVYSRTVGDVFGAPLAMEGLAAFFLESTFLGLWVFGWDRLPKRVHLATIWAVAAGGALSAAFIMAANSWMQHPVGYTVNPNTGRPQLNDVWKLFTNPVFLRGYLHVLLASVVTGAVVMLAVSAWQLRKGRSPLAFHASARLSLLVLVPTLLVAMLVGSELGVTEGKYQPMKIAGAEAQWTTCQPCAFSVFQVGGGNKDQTPTKIIEIPHLLSLLATNHWNGKVLGLNTVQSQYETQYGPGYYVPNIFIQYWAMRVMAYLAVVVLLVGLWGLWLLLRKRLSGARAFQRAATWVVVLPFLMNIAGWLLTESGRQPWIVQGIQLTRNGLSPSITTTTVTISILVFFLLYAALAVVEIVLMRRYARQEPAPVPAGEASQPHLTY
jgi:cytochrome d ubiquinol oxidase subunit I